MKLLELIAKLTAIAEQKPDATVRCEERNAYAYLIKNVHYDADNNAAVLEIDDDPYP